jgi:preprotein translocase subunit YajC
LFFFLQAQQGPAGWTLPALMIGMFAIMYFLMIRPQQKRQREHRQMLESLGKGDRVVTSGGIHGTIVGIKDDVVVLRIDENTKIEINLPNISGKLK